MSNVAPNGGYTALNHRNTLPLWLQAAGYWTSHIGRYLNGYNKIDPPPIPPGWNDWQGLRSGGDSGFSIYDNGVLVSYQRSYLTDVLAARAVETIGEAVQLNRPFFLSIATSAPHVGKNATGYTPPRPAPRHEGAFDTEPLPRPPSFNEANVSDKPASIRQLALLTAEQVQRITALYRGRLGSLLAVDDLVERVVNKLAQVGVLGNTMVVFTSDNGWFQGEHRIAWGKGKVYEEAARVPLLIRGGGFPAGVTVNQYVANIDLAPTIVALAGATPRLVMDGRSLLPIAQNPSLGTTRDLLIEQPGFKAVRNQSFLYAQYNSGERELYDMRRGTPNYDPFQLNSRHASSAYAQIRAQLAAKVNTLGTCSGTSCGAQ
jgi:arylsulfatase A-like enzyme